MGRYCFYCGKKLESNERCNCRYARKNNEQQTESSQGSATQSSSTTNNYNNTDSRNNNSQSNSQNNRSSKGWFSAFQESKEEHARRNKKFSENNQDRNQGNGTTNTTFQSTKERSFLSKLFSFFKNLFTSPTTIISNAKAAKTWHLLIAVLLQALLFALNIFLFVKNSNLSNLIILQDAGSKYNGLARTGFNIFVRAFILSIFLDALRVLVAWIILKLISNQSLNLSDLWKVFLPGIYYSTVLYIVSLLLINGTGLQGLVIIIIVSNLRLLVDIFSIRAWTRFTTDSLIGNTMIIATIIAIVMSLGINFILPNVANFAVAPGKNESQFIPNIKVQRSIYDQISLRNN